MDATRDSGRDYTALVGENERYISVSFAGAICTFIVYFYTLGLVFRDPTHIVPTLLPRGAVPIVFFGGIAVAGVLTVIQATVNDGLVLNWVLGTGFFTSFILHNDLRQIEPVTVVDFSRILWEAAAFGVPLGTVGFLVAMGIRHLGFPKEKETMSLLRLVGLVILSIAVTVVFYYSCFALFGGDCHTADTR